MSAISAVTRPRAAGGRVRLAADGHRSFWLRVRYPLERGDLVLRTALDWDADVEPWEVREDGTCHEFVLQSPSTFLYFKPVLRDGGTARWALGRDYLAVAGSEREVYPRFYDDAGCRVEELRELRCAVSGETHRYRVFCPPGYGENSLRRYPVLYMHDGQNLFFSDEAFGGEHWRVRETLGRLDDMNAIREVIVVGVYPHDRIREYTHPGYEGYGAFLADGLKPRIDHEFRTLRGAGHNALMGSSLGGVASLHVAWERSESFGMAACLSSTFGWRDDLRERIASEPRRPIRIYLDSGWPDDNYEVTRDMRDVLVTRGFREGADLLYFAFPDSVHNEMAWAMRSHLPYQYLFGR